MEMVQNLLLLVAVVVCGLMAQWNQLTKFSLWAFGGMLLPVLIGTLVGWVRGGPEKETRKALAFSTPQRNMGIAMVIASANFAGTPAVTFTVVLAMFLSSAGSSCSSSCASSRIRSHCRGSATVEAT